LAEDRYKEIIIESLSFLTKANRALIYAFVIMSNHFHVVWQMAGDHKRNNVQRDFLKFTSQQLLKIMRNEKLPIMDELAVHAKDRKYQVWERNSLNVPLWTSEVFDQKLDYIHYNPVKAGLCKHPEDYKYSSAAFYYTSNNRWDFLTHCNG